MRTRSALITTGILSAALNILLLSGSIYMMLVYDSVLPSHSVATLIGLFAMVSVVYAFQAVFDVLRSQMLSDIGATFEARIAARVQQAAFDSVLRTPSNPGAARFAMRDLDNIRAFLGSPGPSAFMDLPWILFFVAVLGFLHLWLAVTALVGAAVMVALTLIANRQSREPTEVVASRSVQRTQLAEERWRHAELIKSLGMGSRNLARWWDANTAHLAAQNALSRTTATLGGFSRVFRLLFQSIVLTVGALLVIGGEATGGVIFASSVLAARALAPIDQVIANWRGFAAARGSWTRLTELLEQMPAPQRVLTELPRPQRELAVEDLIVAPPGTQRVTAQVQALRLQAGDVLGIVGPSGSGKSSLLRALVGAWPSVKGSVRLDGAALDQYLPDELGSYIGYLPQTVELLNGTVGENISRFDSEHDSAKIVAAAKAAGVHDLIVTLPKGYDTQVGSDGGQLSAGQRQRIGLARAMYGDPFLIALDEPNSNLDSAGEEALGRAIQSVSDRGGIAVIIAHRSSALNQATYILLMRDARMADFGPKSEMLAKLVSAPAAIRAGDAKAPQDGAQAA